MRNYQVMYYTGASISMLVGLWHFTVPWLFGWASYIPYATLVVSINYVNLCFSFLLSGLSLIPCVLMHALHDFCSFISAEGSMQSDMILGAVQFVILLAYFLYMLNQRRWEGKDTL